MWRNEESIETTGSPEAVWSIFSDPTREPEWDPGCVSAEMRGPFAPGTEVRLKFKGSPARTVKLVDVSPPRSYSAEDRMPLCRMRFDHTVEEAGGGARITITQTIDGPLAPLWSRLLGGRLASGVTEQLAGLDRLARAG